MANAKERSLIASAVAHHKDFRLRLPSSGMFVKPNYDFNAHLLKIGNIVGILSSWDTSKNQGWFEVGQIAVESWSDIRGAVYEVLVVPRLHDTLGIHSIIYGGEQISCLFESAEDEEIQP